MKINLAFGQQNNLSDHVNIDLTTTSPILDTVAEDAECSNIVAEDVIGYFPAEAVGPIIDNWVLKLRHGGQIIVGGIDIGEVCRQFFNKTINLTELNTLIYGEHSERKSALTGHEVAAALKITGLRILKQRINDFHYTVVAERP